MLHVVLCTVYLACAYKIPLLRKRCVKHVWNSAGRYPAQFNPPSGFDEPRPAGVNDYVSKKDFCLHCASEGMGDLGEVLNDWLDAASFDQPSILPISLPLQSPEHVFTSAACP